MSQQEHQKLNGSEEFRPPCFIYAKGLLMVLFILSIIGALIGILLLVFGGVWFDEVEEGNQESRDMLLHVKTLTDGALGILLIISIVGILLQGLTLWSIYRESYWSSVIMLVLAILYCLLTIPGALLKMYDWAVVAIQALYALLLCFYVGQLRTIQKRKRAAEGAALNFY
jgi:hypothetical protein